MQEKLEKGSLLAVILYSFHFIYYICTFMYYMYLAVMGWITYTYSQYTRWETREYTTLLYTTHYTKKKWTKKNSSKPNVTKGRWRKKNRSTFNFFAKAETKQIYILKGLLWLGIFCQILENLWNVTIIFDEIWYFWQVFAILATLLALATTFWPFLPKHWRI